MADETEDIIEHCDFHPCNSPSGMLYYDIRDLKPNQQNELNDFKRNLVRENEQYLAKHSEIRALISMITQHVLRHRPRMELLEFIGHYFHRPKQDLEEEMNAYILKRVMWREPHIYEGNSSVGLNENYIKEGSTCVSSSILSQEGEFAEEEELDFEPIPKDMLDEMLQAAMDRLGSYDVEEEGEVDEKEYVVKRILSEIIDVATDENRKEVLTYLYKSEERYEDGPSTTDGTSTSAVATTSELQPSSEEQTGASQETTESNK